MSAPRVSDEQITKWLAATRRSASGVTAKWDASGLAVRMNVPDLCNDLIAARARIRELEALREKAIEALARSQTWMAVLFGQMQERTEVHPQAKTHLAEDNETVRAALSALREGDRG